jgi:hypothetical protein
VDPSFRSLQVAYHQRSPLHFVRYMRAAEQQARVPQPQCGVNSKLTPTPNRRYDAELCALDFVRGATSSAAVVFPLRSVFSGSLCNKLVDMSRASGVPSSAFNKRTPPTSFPSFSRVHTVHQSHPPLTRACVALDKRRRLYRLYGVLRAGASSLSCESPLGAVRWRPSIPMMRLFSRQASQGSLSQTISQVSNSTIAA